MNVNLQITLVCGADALSGVLPSGRRLIGSLAGSVANVKASLAQHWDGLRLAGI